MERAPGLARRRRAESGFTLVEILVTVAVTMIALMGLFGVFTATNRGNIDARQSAEALALCQGAMDELKAYTVAELETQLGYPTLTPHPATFSAAPFHEGLTVTGASGMTYRREVSGRTIDDELVWLRVDLTWTSEGVPHGVMLEMLRSRSEAPP